MKESPEYVKIEQLLAEAELLIEQISSDLTRDDLEEEHRLEFERHALNLKRIKSEVHDKAGKSETSEILTSADGVHEAVLDIVKSMRDFKNRIF